MNKRFPILAGAIILSSLVIGIVLRIGIFNMPIQGGHSWRQCKTAWNIRYFVREDPNILNPRQAVLNSEDNIVRYEFPLMQWSIAMIEKVMGEHVLIERIVVFLISLLTLFAVFQTIFLLSESYLTSSIAVWIFSFLPNYFFHSVNILPDNLALCFGSWFVYFILKYLRSGTSRDMAVSAVFLSLAALVKLPFILLGVVAFIKFIEVAFTKKTRDTRVALHLAGWYILALIPVAAWYGYAVPSWGGGNDIAVGFTRNFVGTELFLHFLNIQLFTNFPTELLNIPALIMMMAGIYFYFKERSFFELKGKYVFVTLGVLFLYLFYILNNIREGHVYYLMPFYPILIIPIALGSEKLLESVPPVRIVTILLLISMPVFCWAKVGQRWEIKNAFFNEDVFLCREELANAVPDNEEVIIVNDNSLAIFSYVIDKEAHVFYDDHLPVDWIQDLIRRRQVRYLYSDSRTVEEQTGFESCIDSLVLQCGSVQVFKLRSADRLQ